MDKLKEIIIRMLEQGRFYTRQWASKNKPMLMQGLLALLVLVVAVGIFKTLASMRKKPVKKLVVFSAPLLNGQRVQSESMQMIVKGFGTVRPKVEVKIVPQVSGKVIDCHEDFVNGGFFRSKEVLITIDPCDYYLAVENASSAVAQAQVILDKELAEQVVAFKEWAQLYEGEPESPLVRRELQVNHAKAELKAANARLKIAELNLERTKICVPFNGRISEESVDIGQFVTVGQSLATVYSTDAMEIIVPLEDRELAWFDVPLGYRNGEKKVSGKVSRVEVKADFAGGEHTWQGLVLRTEGRIDPMSRMVNVVVEVSDPFKLTNSRPPLVPGMFVEVNIQGREAAGIIRVPRHAVHNRNEVWIEDDGVLRIAEVEIIRQDKEYAYVSSGISDGAVVVTSPLDAVTDGMKIRIELKEDDGLEFDSE